MGTEIDVFISNYTLIDPEIYQLWIDGHSGSEAVAILNQGELGRINGVTLELIASDILDQYRTYCLLEKLLTNPGKLQEQLAFQIEPQTRKLLIEKYYDLDDKVIKELLGKKLSSKHRKDLDEVSEKTGVPLKSCRRQFDNVKRVFKVVEELPGATAQNIRAHFNLSEGLAERYACVLFMAGARFETSKRRLRDLTFASWRQCAQAVMDHWTYKGTGPDYYDTEIDKEFLLELRELKGLLDKEKEHKQLVCSTLRSAGLPGRALQEAEANFRLYARPLVALATGLHRPRDLRNLFAELAQLAEAARQAAWAPADLRRFFDACRRAAADSDALIRDPQLRTTWEKYMKVVSECIIVMYSNI